MNKLLLVLMVLTLVSCNDSQEPFLKIGTNIWPGYEPLYAAQEKGVFENLNISLIEYRSASQVLNGLKSGNINMAATTLDEAIRLYEQGLDIEVVWIFDISNGADALISQPGLDTLNSLKGKRIAYEKSALGEYIFNRFLISEGLKFTDYIIHGLEVNYHSQEMKNKTIDAVFTFEPQLSRIKALGGHILFDSSEIPNEIIDVLIINKSQFNQTHYELFKKFLTQYNTFVIQLLENIDAYIPLLNQRLHLTKKEVNSVYKKIIIPNQKQQLAFFNDKKKIKELISKYEKIFIEDKIMQEPCECEGIFNNQYIKLLDEN